jgi:hypothetical protein
MPLSCLHSSHYSSHTHTCVQEYYEAASSLKFIPHIRTPTLFLVAEVGRGRIRGHILPVYWLADEVWTSQGPMHGARQACVSPPSLHMLPCPPGFSGLVNKTCLCVKVLQVAVQRPISLVAYSCELDCAITLPRLIPCTLVYVCLPPGRPLPGCPP